MYVFDNKPRAYTASTCETKSVRLPKFELPTFDGDILHWQTFWEQFCVAIHDRGDIWDTQKLVHLQHSLKDGSAKSAIEGHLAQASIILRPSTVWSPDTIVLVWFIRHMYMKFLLWKKVLGRNYIVFTMSFNNISGLSKSWAIRIIYHFNDGIEIGSKNNVWVAEIQSEIRWYTTLQWVVGIFESTRSGLWDQYIGYQENTTQWCIYQEVSV
jgi:hypothetical protein